MIECQLVTQEEFARISCMDGFAFGVRTGCDSCEFMLPPCLRRNLMDALYENQRLTEKILGYGLCERYVVEEIPWRADCLPELQWKGVVALNVQQQITRLGDDFEVSPFVIEDAPVTLEGDQQIVVVDKNLVSNPSWVVFRDPITNGSEERDVTYPVKRDGDGNWIIGIDTELEAVNVQICKYIAVTVDTFTDASEVVAVKPNTEIVIPFAKPATINDDDTTTYWFYAWSLVDPAFEEDEEINLEAGEFYKLLQYIGFVRIEEVEAAPVLIWSDLTEDDEALTLTQRFDNIIHVKLTDTFSQDCNPATLLKMRVYYRVDPSLLGIDTGNIAEAIAWLTAAEMPYKNCNCELPEYGFVWQAQQPYSNAKVNPIAGTTTIITKYGTMHGQMVYEERLRKATNPKSRKTVRI